MEPIQKLIEVLSIPSFSGKEKKVAEYIIKFCLDNNINVYSDEYGNVYATKGVADYYPCVVSHIDTVHPIREFVVHNEDGVLFALTEDGYKTGIGGDDKAGVFVCLEMLLSVKNIKAAFFVSEEVGCFGSYLSDPKFFENVGYAIQFDAPYHNWISHYSDGEKLFELDSDFFQKIEPIFKTDIKDYSSKCLHDWHPYTDVSALKRLYDFSCINVSVGYQGMHTINEIVIIDDVFISLEMAKKMVKSLGEIKYELKSKTIISEGFKNHKKRRLADLQQK